MTIRGLIEAVERGDWLSVMTVADAVFPCDGAGVDSRNKCFWVQDAYRGSLDAAERLHDALLPGGSQYSITVEPTCLCARVAWWPDGLAGKRTLVAEAWGEGNPARAWLLAILRAQERSEG